MISTVPASGSPAGQQQAEVAVTDPVGFEELADTSEPARRQLHGSQVRVRLHAIAQPSTCSHSAGQRDGRLPAEPRASRPEPASADLRQ
jgi:hypothetical protein